LVLCRLYILGLGSTAPFTADSNHGLGYRSGMLQSWNKFCFTTGYVEVSVTLPGPDENTKGYVSIPFFFLFFCVVRVFVGCYVVEVKFHLHKLIGLHDMKSVHFSSSSH
jgi:hypothetical protein